MKRFLSFALALLLPGLAWGQAAVQQTGPVTANTPAMWAGNQHIRQGAGEAGDIAGKMITGGFSAVGKVCSFSDTTDKTPNHRLCLNGADGTISYDGVTYLPGPGNGDVIGPTGAGNGNIVLFNGPSGKLIKDSGISIHAVPGAIGNGTTDDSAAIIAALNAMPPGGGTLFLDPAKKYLLNASITLPSNVALDCGSSPGYTDLTSSGSLMSLGGIRLSSSATIFMGAGSRVQQCPIFRAGATFPTQTPAGYAGTAITYVGGNTPDTVLQDLLIVGFGTCVDQSNKADRFRWLNVECDAVNAFKIGPSADTSDLSKVRAWPWGTAHYPTTPTLTRSGTGFLITGADRLDDLRGTGVLDFGHTTGMDIENPSGNCCNIHLDDVWFDNNSTAALVNKANNVTFGKMWAFGTNAGPGLVLDAFNAVTGISQLYITGYTNCLQLDNGAGAAINFAEIGACSNKVGVLSHSAAVLQIKAGRINPTLTTNKPYFTLASGIVSGSFDVNVGIPTGFQTDLLGSLSINPLRSLGDPVGQSTGITAPTSVIAGPGQTTAALSETGPLGGSLMLKDTNNLLGSGGAILFGANGNHMRYGAAIKGSQVAGGASTISDIKVAVRVLDTDPTLTEIASFNHGGHFRVSKPTAFAAIEGCAVGIRGAIQVITDSNTVTWGANIAGGGANVVMGFCNGTNWTVMAK